MPRLPKGPSRAALLLMLVRPLRDHVSDLRAWTARYGDPLAFPTLQGPIVATADPEAIKAIYTADPETYAPAMSAAFGPFLGENSVLLLAGARHRAARRLLSPPFHGGRMRAYGRLMRDAALKWAGRWRPGEPFALQDTTQAISLEVIIRAVFGVTDEERERRFHQAILDLMAAVRPAIVALPALRRELFGLGPWARYQRARRPVEELIFAEIASRRAAPQPGEDILSLLVQARYEDGSPMGDREILDQLITMVVAGHETTAVTLAWAAYALHRHPDTLARLLQEIDALGPAPEPDALARLPYLEAVCQETLRRYPLSLVLSRKLVRPLTLKGYELPPGTLVGVSALVHFREELYPEPERFHPERFLGRTPSPFEFVPFGGGARRCLGAAFASYEMKIVLGTLLQRFRLRLVRDEEIGLVVRAATIAPAEGVPMVLEGRRGEG